MLGSLIALATFSMGAFAAVLFAAQAVAREIGFYLGKRAAARADGPAEGVGVVVGGMLGLLGFVLALTLSFSNARFQDRQQGTLAEANAIGTAWLRAEAIGHPRGAEIARLLREYTQVRMDFVLADVGSPSIGEINQRTASMQNEIWGHLSALVRERPDPVSTSLMASLNDVFDQATAERFAFSIIMPPSLFWLLIGMTMLSMAALGYQFGLRGRSLRWMSLMLMGMWTVVIVVILDLGSARLGTIRIGTQAYQWTLQGFQGGISIPTPPAR